jgi:hypothetical protein
MVVYAVGGADAGPEGEPVLFLVVMLASLAVMLFVLFWLGSTFVQRGLYTEPSEGLAWRAGVSTGLLTLLFAGWCALNARATDPTNLPFDTLFNFHGYSDKAVDKFWSLKVTSPGKPPTTTVFTQRKASRGASEYIDEKGKPWARSDSGMVVAVETADTPDGPRTRFEAELTPDGTTFRMAPGETAVRYREVGGGRYMMSNQIGTVVTPRTGLVAGNLALNLGHFLLWLAVFAALLRYSFWHALGLAIVFWLAATLVLLPTLFQKVAAVIGGTTG